MREHIENINLRPPARWRQVLEKYHLKEIEPRHLCNSEHDYFLLGQKYPDLLGDRTTIDIGLGGRCQSWRDCPGWWKRII